MGLRTWSSTGIGKSFGAKAHRIWLCKVKSLLTDPGSFMGPHIFYHRAQGPRVQNYWSLSGPTILDFSHIFWAHLRPSWAHRWAPAHLLPTPDPIEQFFYWFTFFWNPTINFWAISTIWKSTTCEMSQGVLLVRFVSILLLTSVVRKYL